MPRKIDNITDAQTAYWYLLNAQLHLGEALTYARRADAPRIAARLKAQRAALCGALRHAVRRECAAQEGRPLTRRGIRKD